MPVGCDEMYLVRSSFTLTDGTTLCGFATPAGEEEAWGLMQPQLFLPSGRRLDVWFGMFPPPNALSDFCAALGKKSDRPQVFEPPRVLVWELVMGCIWIAVEAGPTEGGRRPTGVGAAVSWAA